MMQYLDRLYFFLSRHSIRAWLYTLLSLFIMFFCAELALGLSAQQELSRHVIRFHVSAAGNSPEEQELKQQVYDAVLAELETLLEGAASAREAEERIRAGIPLLQERAENVVEAAEEVSLSFGEEVFPTRISQGKTLPAGRYMTLRIRLGEGEGHNWWCLLFPGEEGLSEKEEGWILEEEQTEEVKARFWLLEQWQKWMEAWFGRNS